MQEFVMHAAFSMSIHLEINSVELSFNGTYIQVLIGLQLCSLIYVSVV